MHLYFDLDGTLFETKPVVVSAARVFLEQLGRPYPGDDAILSQVGRPMPQFMQGILNAPTVSGGEIALFDALERAEVRKSGRLFSGTEGVLQKLHEEGHTLFLLSNGQMEYIELVLQTTGIRSLFQDVYTAGASPSKAYKLREVLPVNTPALFVGDTIDDLQAARQNNIPHIAALFGYGGAAAYDSASHKAYSPQDILTIVRRLCADLHCL